MRAAAAGERSAVVREWFERTLRATLNRPRDSCAARRIRFAIPSATRFGTGWGCCSTSSLGELDQARIAAALDAIVRIRAVQDHTASQAVAFLFLLKDVASRKVLGGGLGNAWITGSIGWPCWRSICS